LFAIGVGQLVSDWCCDSDESGLGQQGVQNV
jgi:hypothetical protein